MLQLLALSELAASFGDRERGQCEVHGGGQWGSRTRPSLEAITV
jgi:hypothetical protein